VALLVDGLDGGHQGVEGARVRRGEYAILGFKGAEVTVVGGELTDYSVAGVALLGFAVGTESLGTLIASASVVGIGQGLVIGAGLAAINQRAPVERRGETASSFFVVMYVGLSVPVIGVGVVANATSLKTAGIVFSAAVAALVLVVLASLARSG